MPDNGETKYWLRWLVGVVWAGLTLIISITATNVIANEEKCVVRDGEQADQIAELQKCQAETKVELAYIKDTLTEQKSDIKAILKAVKQ